ncbi:MAG: response regulator transcription factor [Chloroflexota bacterium]
MRILLVEDDKKISSYTKRGLEEHGHAVDAVYSGGQVLEWVEAVSFDLVLLDILLPEMSGLEVCRALRKRGYNMPVLMLTAKDTVDDRVDGLDAGADDYLVKPFELKELLARLRALGRRVGEEPKTPTLRVANLELDTLSHRAHREEITVELRTKEYAILEYLMRHPDQVLTRAMIAEHVWNYEEYHRSNVVDVYIRNLRRMLDDPFENKLILTVRGTGYKISSVEKRDETT